MNWKEFIIELLKLISFNIITGLTLYTIWKYIDMKYFSKLEISTLKEENKYLRKENQKINGNSSDFWNESDIK